jgi:hypothetical protein
MTNNEQLYQNLDISISESCESGFYSLEEIVFELLRYHDNFSISAMDWATKVYHKGEKEMLAKIIVYLQKVGNLAVCDD